MKHTSKQLKGIWPKLVLNMQLNKIKLSKQQKAAAIYMTFYSYHYTDMWWTRGYQIRVSACEPRRSWVWSSWCWCIINIIWREAGRREAGRQGVGGRKEGREEKEDRKNGKRGNKSNIELELSNFRYHRNCYQDVANNLQINTVKSTYDHASSDKAPSSIF